MKISDDFRLRRRVWPLLWWFTSQNVYQDVGLGGGLPWLYSNGLYKHFTNICCFLENSELCHPKSLGYSIQISWVGAVNTNQKGNWHFCLFLFPSSALNVCIHIGEFEDDPGQTEGGGRKASFFSPFLCVLTCKPPFNKMKFQHSREKKSCL